MKEFSVIEKQPRGHAKSLLAAGFFSAARFFRAHRHFARRFHFSSCACAYREKGKNVVLPFSENFLFTQISPNETAAICRDWKENPMFAALCGFASGFLSLRDLLRFPFYISRANSLFPLSPPMRRTGKKAKAWFCLFQRVWFTKILSS